eukprot:CAMPEP_0197446722 /NCGR_PEP_ID=MMETSP1175-20131217/11600_1 /TAXON_ID=1003142 /ORGANISM="Triceratium dubium, Strain CCMP147" /LENGTH=447 /DNA_ID=CAMNT_0042977879 /DNA_START=158 /DNA_END=1501 /DNA_ORIENTATION=-
MATQLPKRKRSDSYDQDDGQTSSDDEAGPRGEPGKMEVPAGMGGDEASRREARLSKNRAKARERRNRKKVMIEEMQRNVVVLSRMNSELRRKNQDLMRKLSQYGPAGGVDPSALASINAGVGGVAQGMLGSEGPASLTSAGTAGQLAGAASQLAGATGQHLASASSQGAQLQLPTATDLNEATSSFKDSISGGTTGPDVSAAAAASASSSSDVQNILSRYQGFNPNAGAASAALTGGMGAGAASAAGGIGAGGIGGAGGIDPALLQAYLNQQQNAMGGAGAGPQAGQLGSLAGGQLGGLAGVAGAAASGLGGLPGSAAGAGGMGSLPGAAGVGGLTGATSTAGANSSQGSDGQVHIVVHHHHDGQNSSAQGGGGGQGAGAGPTSVPSAGTAAGPAGFSGAPNAAALNAAGISGAQGGIQAALARQLNSLQGAGGGMPNIARGPGSQI